MDSKALLFKATLLVPWLLSLAVHEFAHAWSANRLGDDTAAREGRMTLNPVRHLDLLGSIVMPLFVGFGWARPVPVDPSRFRRSVPMWRGMAITASAGPISNVLLALALSVAFGGLLRFMPEAVAPEGPLRLLLAHAIQLNVALAVFNMIPVPPLDGSRIAAWLVPAGMRRQWLILESFGPILLLLVFFNAGRLIGGPVDALTDLLFSITRAIAPRIA